MTMIDYLRAALVLVLFFALGYGARFASRLTHRRWPRVTSVLTRLGSISLAFGIGLTIYVVIAVFVLKIMPK